MNHNNPRAGFIPIIVLGALIIAAAAALIPLSSVLNKQSADIRPRAAEPAECSTSTDNCSVGSGKCSGTTSYTCISYSVYCSSGHGVWRVGGNSCAAAPAAPAPQQPVQQPTQPQAPSQPTQSNPTTSVTSGCDNGVKVGGTACQTQGGGSQFRCQAGSVPGKSIWKEESCNGGTCVGVACTTTTSPTTTTSSSPSSPASTLPSPNAAGVCPAGSWNQCGGCLAGKCVSSAQTCNTSIDQYCGKGTNGNTCAGEGAAAPVASDCCTGLTLCGNGRCLKSCAATNQPGVPTLSSCTEACLNTPQSYCNCPLNSCAYTQASIGSTCGGTKGAPIPTVASNACSLSTGSVIDRTLNTYCCDKIVHSGACPGVSAPVTCTKDGAAPTTTLPCCRRDSNGNQIKYKNSFGTDICGDAPPKPVCQFSTQTDCQLVTHNIVCVQTANGCWDAAPSGNTCTNLNGCVRWGF